MNARLSPEQSNRIANLGFVCTLLVVFIHLRNVPRDVGSFAWSLHYLVRNLLACVAVPYFFVVSGYFLGRHADEPGWWRRAIAQRARTLGVPLLVWCLVPCLLFSCLLTAGDAGGECVRVAPRLSSVAAAFGLNFFTSPEANRPLWYLRALLLLTLVSPLLVWVLRKSRGYVLVALLALCWAVNPGTLDFPGFWLNLRWRIFFVFGVPVEGLLYFCLGLWLSVRPLSLSRRTGWILGVVGLAVGLVGLCLCSRGIVGWSYCVTVSIPLMLGFVWSLTPGCSWPKGLTGSAFAMYVVHSLWIRIVNVGGIVVGGEWAFVIESIVVVSLSLATAVALHRALPKVSNAVFGGR